MRRIYALVSLLSLAALLGLPSAPLRAGEPPAEDLKPKRQLTAEQDAQAKEYKQQIQAEKTRLAEIRKPLDAIIGQIKEPEGKLNEVSGAIRKVSTLIDDNFKERTKFDPKSPVMGQIKEACKVLGADAPKYYELNEKILGMEKNRADKKEAKGDDQKLKALEEEQTKLEERMTAKYRQVLDKLYDLRRTEQDKFDEASQPLVLLRLKLKQLYGYEVEGGGLLMADAEGAADASTKLWLDEQALLIERLTLMGYDDLADLFFTRIDKTPDPFTGKPLTDASRIYLTKTGAKLRLRKAVNAKDLKEKLLVGEDAIALYQKVIANLVPMTPSHIDARTELIQARFDLADSIADQLRQNFVFGGELPTADARYKAPAKPAAPLTEAALAGDEKKVGKLAIEYANRLFAEGMTDALALGEKLNDTFLDLIDTYMKAREEKDKEKEQKFYRLLSKFSPQKLRVQHGVEAAYGSWADIFAPGSKEREELVAEGNEYIDANLPDYRQIWGNDKIVFANWMLMNSVLSEPLFVKGADGKPLPSFNRGDPEEWKALTPEEQKEEQRNITRYNWPAERVELIFNGYVVGKDKGVASKNSALQAMRLRALYAWIQARINLAYTHYSLADQEADAGKKKDLLAHADKLSAKAIEALHELDKPASIVGEIDAFTRSKAKLTMGVEYFLYLSDRAVKAGDKAKATDYSMQALTQAATIRSTGEGVWRTLAGDALLTIVEFNKKNELESGDPSEAPVALLATQAENAFRTGLDAERSGRKAQSRKSLQDSCELYLTLVDRSRKVADKKQRDNVLPRALYNLGIAAAKLENFDLSFIANQALAQEFRNDFADPSRNYPPQQYPNGAKYLTDALNNLRAAANAQLKVSSTPSARKNYVDALLMNVRSSGRGEDYVALIKTLSELKEYESAVAFIDNVPDTNDYYRITQLMAASIYLDMIKRAVRELNTIDLTLNPLPDENGKIPEDKVVAPAKRKELEERAAKLKEGVKEYRTAAAKYATLFIDLHRQAAEQWKKDLEQGIKATAAVQGIRDQEKTNLLQAMLIPLSISFESQEWDAVLKGVPEYYKVLADQKDVSEADKRYYYSTAAWLAFNATFRQKDYQKDDVAACVANLQATEAAQAELAKYDTENQYLSDAASLLGSAWLGLGQREKTANHADKEKEYSIKAVNWLDKAESRIYEQLSTGLKMGGTLTEQKIFARAEDVLSKVVEFWSEARFNPKSLYQSGQGAAGMKQQDSAVADALDKSFSAAAIGAAASAGDERLIETLNGLLKSAKYEDNPEGITKALEAVLASNKSGTRMGKLAETGLKLTQGFVPPDKEVLAILKGRPYPRPGADLQGRLNRILLQLAYPKTLYQQPPTPVLPTMAQTVQAAMQIDRSYTSEAGRNKAAVLVAMIAPEVIRGRSAGIMVFGEEAEKGKGGLVGKLTADVAAASDAQQKAKIQGMLDILSTPLLVSLYGTPDKQGRLVDRSYGRARATIKAILDYDAATPTDEKLPVLEFLRDMDNALVFESMILLAKRDYAKAMVENANFLKAEKYVQELTVLFPTDWTLTLDLGNIYLAMAAQSQADKTGKKAARPFSKEAAADFLRAFVQANMVLSKSPMGSDPYWQSQKLMIAARMGAVESRAKAGEDLKAGFTADVKLYDPVSGKSNVRQVPVRKYDDEGRQLAMDITRILAKVDPKVPDELAGEFKDYLERLAKLGFKVAEVKPEDAELSK